MRPLAEYTRKRNFRITAEPGAKVPKRKRSTKQKPLLFVVQEHHASHLHYDFRLEWNGVLKSWAVPKGPSLDPSQKRLAVEVEDHPYDYAKFTGTIPAGQYGAGEVYRWDMGTWMPKGDVDQGLKKGRLEFTLKGKKLKGDFVLVRTGRRASKPNWLLIKRHDDYAREDMKLAAISLPEFIPPQLAQLVTKPPLGEDWIHEIKFDGYRIQAHIHNGKVKLYTRKGLDWTTKYSILAKALEKLKVESAVLDGEVVWQDDKGRSDFQLLQNAMKAEKTNSLLYWVFDLMYLNGDDLTSLPLISRKDRLAKILKGAKGDHIRFSEHFRGAGDKMIKASCQMHLEGIVSKRVDAPYVPGRHDDWVKAKCVKRQEFVIGGFSDPEGSRTSFGSLLLGAYESGKLKYVGKCGTGFNRISLRDVGAKLRKLEAKKSPFELNAPKGRGLHWVKPNLVCEVSYAEMTQGGHLRVPVFKGLRVDKSPKAIGIEKPKKVKGDHVIKSAHSRGDIHISHPDRIIFEKERLTKLDVAKYYDAAADWILPHIANRPLALVRCTQNSTTACFFSKHFRQRLPEHIVEIPEKGSEPWITVDSREGLRQLIQWGTLEIHPWNTHAEHIDNPDQIVMDFDPDGDVDFGIVKEGALELRELLKKLGLKSFVKVTGGKGLHVQFPIEPLYDWDSVKNFSKTLVQEFVSRYPDLYTANMSKKVRKGKIFLDYLRNGRGSTAIAPYALRARAKSAVAMPITWEELGKLKAANVYTLKKALEVFKRRKPDPWKDYFRIKQKIALLP